MQRNDILVWVDLEMTSLQNVLKDQIIEIAVVLTDADLNVVAEGPDIVIHAPKRLFESAPLEVQEMHRNSGIEKAALSSTTTLKEAEEKVLAFLKEHVQPQSSPLCGNSIYMDRHFLRMQMPELDAYLHYRCIDVSSVKELARRWVPDVFAQFSKDAPHRAKDDILASIEELRFWREHFIGAR